MKKTYMVLGVLALLACVVMFVVGSGSSHMSELKDFSWLPIPLAVVFLALGAKAKAK